MDATTRKHLLCVCETAIFIALAFVLNFAKLEFAWLQGGSISLVDDPDSGAVAAPRRRLGHSCRFDFGHHRLRDGRRLRLGNLDSVLLDYLLAYAAVGTCGFFYKMRKAGRWSARWSAACFALWYTLSAA